MFDTVLVADRGLLACRVVHTCQRLGARAVTVHSAADAGRLHSRCADESLLLGSADPASTYLDGLKVIEAAGQAGAQALHPGASPLAASAAFATSVQDAGLTWLGADPEVLTALVGAASDPAPAARTVTVLAPAGGPAVVLGETVRAGALVACPAPPDEAARSAALEAVRALGAVGLARVAVDADARVLVVEPWLGLDSAAVELVTGVDLVEQQLLLADGKDVVGDVRADGASVLLALRAPTGGRIRRLDLPADDALLLSAGAAEGEDVPAGEVVLTLTAWGQDDARARERLHAARGRLVVDGIELEESP